MRELLAQRTSLYEFKFLSIPAPIAIQVDCAEYSLSGDSPLYSIELGILKQSVHDWGTNKRGEVGRNRVTMLANFWISTIFPDRDSLLHCRTMVDGRLVWATALFLSAIMPYLRECLSLHTSAKFAKNWRNREIWIQVLKQVERDLTKSAIFAILIIKELSNTSDIMQMA